jgi:hypothetical protein
MLQITASKIADGSGTCATAGRVTNRGSILTESNWAHHQFASSRRRERRCPALIPQSIAPRPTSVAVPGSGIALMNCSDELAGVHVAPPSTLSSVKTSKKLAIRYWPPGMSRRRIWAVETSVGDSRSRMPATESTTSNESTVKSNWWIGPCNWN